MITTPSATESPRPGAASTGASESVASWLAAPSIPSAVTCLVALWALAGTQFAQLAPAMDLVEQHGFALGRFAIAFDLHRVLFGWPVGLAALVLAAHGVARYSLHRAARSSGAPPQAPLGCDLLVCPPGLTPDRLVAALDGHLPAMRWRQRGPAGLVGRRGARNEALALAIAALTCIGIAAALHQSPARRGRVVVQEHLGADLPVSGTRQRPGPERWMRTDALPLPACGPGAALQARSCRVGDAVGTLAWGFPLHVEGWNLSYERIVSGGGGGGGRAIALGPGGRVLGEAALGSTYRIPSGPDEREAMVAPAPGPDGLLVGVSAAGEPHTRVLAGPSTRPPTEGVDLRMQQPASLVLAAHQSAYAWWGVAGVALAALALCVWLLLADLRIRIDRSEAESTMIVSVRSTNRPSLVPVTRARLRAALSAPRPEGAPEVSS